MQEIGIEFEISPADIDENPRQQEPPLKYVDRMAAHKRDTVMDRFPELWVVAADTIVFVDDTILGKPSCESDALATLMLLRGRVHRVATSFALGNRKLAKVHDETVVTKVEFSRFSEQTARAYVQTGEGVDKAGAYAIQGRGGVLVKELQGSYSNVVGLPLCELVFALNKYGIVKTN